MDLISIITPVYNTGKYLSGCLDSCLKQTYTNLEIIIIDDCSTDPLTLDLLNKYKDIDPRLKVVFNKENRGQGFCRNEGLKYIHGKYFAYIDSDDTFVPNAIEQLHKAIVHYKTDFVQSDVHNINAEDIFSDNDGFVPANINEKCRDYFNFNGQENVVFDLPTLIAQGHLFNVPALCYGKLFNTASYLKAQILFDDGPYSRHCQDEDWSTQMLLKLKSFVFIKFVSVVRFILKKSASTPSVKYYKSALAACARRFKLVDRPNLPAFYKYSVLSFAIERTSMLLRKASTNSEYRSLCQFASEMLESYRPLLQASIYPAYTSPLFDSYTIQRMLSHAYPERPCICYFSLQSPFDTTAPEVLSVLSVLEHLAACGFNVFTLSGQITKGPKGDGLFEKLAFKAKQNNLANSFAHMPGLKHFFHNGVNHYGIDLSYNLIGHEALQNPNDIHALRNAVKAIFASNTPDILLTTSTDNTTWNILPSLAKSCARLKAQTHKSAAQKPTLDSTFTSDVNSEASTDIPADFTLNSAVDSKLPARNTLPIVYIPIKTQEPPFVPHCDLIATFSSSQAKIYEQLVDHSSCTVKNLGYTPFPTWSILPETTISNNQALITTLGTTLTTEYAIKIFPKSDSFALSSKTPATQNELCPNTTLSSCISSTLDSSNSSNASPLELEQPCSYLDEVRKLDSQHLTGTITLLSPEFEHGLSIFMGLVMYCAEHHPELEFVLLNSPSATAAKNLAKLHTQDGKLLSQLQPNLKHLKILGFTELIAPVYAQTKVMLHLPLGTCVEALTSLYATWQGIKVLTLDHHIIADTLTASIPEKHHSQAFATIQLPNSTLSDHTCLPSSQELVPIVQSLEHLLATKHTALSYLEQKQQILAHVNKWQQSLCAFLPQDQQASLHQVYKLI